MPLAIFRCRDAKDLERVRIGVVGVDVGRDVVWRIGDYFS